jgi:carboxymethylenebutenolidase
MSGNLITLDVNGHPVNAYLALPPGDSGPGVLLLHAWWGLKPFFKQLCDRLAEQGFVALAPDLRDGKVAQTIDEAKALMEASDSEAAGDIVMAAKDFLRAHASVRGEKIGVIGFSMGAAWALIVAGYKPDQVGATVLFYGAGEADFGKVTSKIQGHYSPDDEWEPYDYVQAMERDMKAAGVDVSFYNYPGTKHWFVEDDRPEYDAQAAALAWARTFEFLRENL